MLKKIVILSLTVLLIVTVSRFEKVYAEENSLSNIIEKTIENDKEVLSKLSPTLEKLYEAAIKAFKKFGTLSKEISDVVKLFNDLDETEEDYEQKLAEFFDRYNSLSPYKRKIVNAITGLIDLKDHLKDSIRNSIVVDMYSTKQISCELVGKLDYQIGNETIAEINDRGVITPVSIGYTSLTVKNELDEEIIYRIFVKKPILSSSIAVKWKGSVTIKLPADESVTEIRTSNKKVTVKNEAGKLTVKGKKKGTAYIYVGTASGKTLKYKIKVS